MDEQITQGQGSWLPHLPSNEISIQKPVSTFGQLRNHRYVLVRGKLCKTFHELKKDTWFRRWLKSLAEKYMDWSCNVYIGVRLNRYESQHIAKALLDDDFISADPTRAIYGLPPVENK